MLDKSGCLQYDFLSLNFLFRKKIYVLNFTFLKVNTFLFSYSKAQYFTKNYDVNNLDTYQTSIENHKYQFTFDMN